MISQQQVNNSLISIFPMSDLLQQSAKYVFIGAKIPNPKLSML